MNSAYAAFQFLTSEKEIPKHNLVGVFLFGSQNYGLDIESSDRDYIALYTPTLKNVCSYTIFIGKEYAFRGGLIKLIDIRDYIKNLKFCSPDSLEILFSKDYYLNIEYITEFSKIMDNRESVAYVNPHSAIVKMRGMAKQHYLGFKKDVSKVKKLVVLIRMRYLITAYVSGFFKLGANYGDMLLNSPQECLKELKRGNSFFGEDIIPESLIAAADFEMNDIEKCYENAMKIEDFEVQDSEMINMIDETLKQIVKIGLKV